MLNRLIFALIIFCFLLVIPNVALSFFEQNLNLPTEASEVISQENNENNKTVQEQIKDYEPVLIKIYNLKTNNVMVLDLEEYLKGVVSSEMPAEFNYEALKAQAVTARTYLLYRLKKFPDGQPEHMDAPVCTGTHCQVWSSKEDLIASHPEGWYETYWSKIEQAVNSTRGQILTYEGKIIEPLFHSTSGGRTENSEDVFSAAVPYLRSVESPYESEAPKLHSSIKMSVNEFINKINSVYGKIDINSKNLKDKIVLGEVSEGGKVKTLFINNVKITGREMRSLFNLNSTNFSFIQSGDQIEIVTTGYGHGVGMSQYGANGMAEEGYNYKEILKHYYTGVEIANIN